MHLGIYFWKFFIKKNWNKPFPLNPEFIEYGTGKAEIIDFSIVDCNGNVTNLIEKWEAWVANEVES